MKLNKHFELLSENYLFREVGKRVEEFKKANPQVRVANLGIGDVTLPIVDEVAAAGARAAYEMASSETIRGYCDSEGYLFLREAIAREYQAANVKVEPDEVFVNDGSKGAMANFLRLFGRCTAIIPNPVYPAYLDANIVAGNAVIFSDCNESNNFVSSPLARDCSLIYICSPANPSGVVYSRDELAQWVDYARFAGAVILFDAAYSAFIEGDDYPRSIFEIKGASTCAIEFNSFSKSAGFTGVRCGYTIVPKNTRIYKMYKRFINLSYNGTAYIVQRMAQAALLNKQSILEQIAIYKQNSLKIRQALDSEGLTYWGGVHSPYIWLKCDCDSWKYFDYMLNENHIVGTPGCGFGSGGEGYFRLSAFGLTALDTLKF